MVPFRIEIGSSVGGLYVQLDEMESSIRLEVRERVGGEGPFWMRTYFLSQSMWILFFHAMLGEDNEKPQEADVLLKYLIIE